MARKKADRQLELDFRRTPAPAPRDETFDDALETTFPIGPPTEQQLYEEFLRLFPE